MESIRLHRVVESETLHLPELNPFIGKSVEIVIREDAKSNCDPQQFEAFLALVGSNAVDPDAYQRLRDASQI